jgi:serine/threonine protein kinase
VGEERAGTFAAGDGSWRAAAQRFAPGLVLWTYAALDPGAASARQANARTGTAVVWSGTLLVAAAAVLLGRRAARPKETAGAASAEGAVPVEIDEDAESEGAESGDRAAGGPLAASPFGGYLLLDRLAAGGKAEVYSAVSAGPERLRRTCVVKRLRPEVARKPEAISSFVSEARLASVLVHANVVPVFEFGRAGDEYFLAQEYVIGRDLGRVVRRSLEKDRKPLPTLQAFYAAQQTLFALEYAHGRLDDRGAPLGLVHRDVSPNNILVSARGEVKLFDFGIARQSGPARSSDGIVQGNVRFMSPEQARAEAVDARSDLFALGLVLYYALAGKALYDAEDGYALLLQAAQGPGEAQLQRIAALPESAAAIVTRALKPDPAQRFQTAGEFAAALSGGAGQRQALARTMDRLFAADLAQEEARFLAALARPRHRA